MFKVGDRIVWKGLHAATLISSEDIYWHIKLDTGANIIARQSDISLLA